MPGLAMVGASYHALAGSSDNIGAFHWFFALMTTRGSARDRTSVGRERHCLMAGYFAMCLWGTQCCYA